MIFHGIGRRFRTENDRQYEDIGRFWDDMAAVYGREYLLGLGWDWREDSLMYAIGRMDQLFEGSMPGMDAICLELPESGWQSWRGETDRLDELYGRIYRDGPLIYEIERFSDDGKCRIDVYREQK